MKRKGFSLVEVLVAIAVAASALVVVMGLANSSVSGARGDVGRFAQDQVTAQVAELLAGESLPRLRRVAAGGADALTQVITRRLRHLPPEAREAVTTASAELMGALVCTLDEDVGGHRGLTRITVSRGAGTLSIVRLVRKKHRA